MGFNLGQSLNDVASAVGNTAKATVQDVGRDPLGAAGLGLAALSAAPAVLLAAAGSATVLPAAYGVAAATDALGVTHDLHDDMARTALNVVTHPAELGRAVIKAEGQIAAKLAPGPVSAAIAKVTSGPSSPSDAAEGKQTGGDAAAVAAAVNPAQPLAPIQSAAPGFFARLWSEVRYAFTGSR